MWATGVKDDDGKDIFILLKDAASYIDEDFSVIWYVYCTTENLGVLPFSGGWAEQPLWVTQALNILKTESAKMDKEELDERMKN